MGEGSAFPPEEQRAVAVDRRCDFDGIKVISRSQSSIMRQKGNVSHISKSKGIANFFLLKAHRVSHRIPKGTGDKQSLIIRLSNRELKNKRCHI